MEIEGSSPQDWTIAVDEKYSLRLFVAGASSMSVKAIKNLQVILENNLKGKYELEIIDIHQQPLLLQKEDIFAVPLLIKKYPAPIRRLVGDMSDVNKVLKGLGLN
ncbi:circadian clock protein KaiB [Pedobacter polaris]|uniref:Circadian clock protein KaiB n=1 Tax=Pedobacter polaris TaxID=2571273 RepID=A0A4U1CHH1_9SPHI|nr:circadian clock KaiB family protein [Pedobacter polaris]TKC06721.1 circadian clock protein KaiB [Pedobacter polaris]